MRCQWQCNHSLHLVSQTNQNSSECDDSLLASAAWKMSVSIQLIEPRGPDEEV